MTSKRMKSKRNNRNHRFPRDNRVHQPDFQSPADVSLARNSLHQFVAGTVRGHPFAGGDGEEKEGGSVTDDE